MRLNCCLAVNSRLAPQAGLKSRAPIKASLVIGFKENADVSKVAKAAQKSDNNSANSKEVVIMEYSAKNVAGTCYRVKGNLKVFCRFAAQGQATLQFDQPPHDLLISKAEPFHLKTFLQALSTGLRGGGTPTAGIDEQPQSSLLCLSKSGRTSDTSASRKILMPARQNSGCIDLPDVGNLRKIKDVGIQERLCITSKTNYPFKRGFCKTLKILEIQNLLLERVESRIVSLPKLTKLDLRSNRLSEKSFPPLSSKCDDYLPNLATLILDDNKFTKLPGFLCDNSFALKSVISMLSMKNNQISVLSSSVCRLSQLAFLHLDNNQIASLPNELGLVRTLRVLTVSKNMISSFPHSISRKSFLEMDISENPCYSHVRVERSIPAVPSPVQILTLKELATVCVAENKSSFILTPDRVPWTLIDDVNQSKKCSNCHRWVFEHFSKLIRALPKTDLNVGQLTVSEGEDFVNFEGVLCLMCSRLDRRTKR